MINYNNYYGTLIWQVLTIDWYWVTPGNPHSPKGRHAGKSCARERGQRLWKSRLERGFEPKKTSSWLLALMTLYEIDLPSTRKCVVLKPLSRAIQGPAHRQGCCQPIQCRPVGLGLQSFVLITVQLVINIIRCWGELKSFNKTSKCWWSEARVYYKLVMRAINRIQATFEFQKPSLLIWDQVHDLSCENEFYLH